ncbi:MAG: S26 family signal peptidase [Planctomycetota bacterium]
MNELESNPTPSLVAEPPPRRIVHAAPPHQREGIKDTIESIVIALVLAFVFRAFVVEAFVIPTGSMAPTLYGAHATILCEDCGTEFAYGLRDPDDSRGFSMVEANAVAICPNCGQPNARLRLRDDMGLPEKGDRILVFKWPFDIGGPGLDPARWDVVVFKDPEDGVTNFIKRCAGMPNEVLMILDGDVYTVPISELSPETVAELERNIHEKHLRYTHADQGLLPQISARAYEELDGKLRIAGKTPVAQRSLWHTVYDNDYPPRKPSNGQPHWVAVRGAASGWDTSSRRIQFHPCEARDDYITIVGKEIRAGNAYNIREGSAPIVSDQRVRFVLTPKDSQGIVRVGLSKWGRAFRASLGMDGSVSLTESKEGTTDPERMMSSATLQPFAVGQSVEIQFENVDYRLALTVEGKEVLSSSSDPSSPAYYAPEVGKLRREKRVPSAIPPRIEVEGGAFELTHLAVDRDEYYFHDMRMNPLQRLPWAPRMGWGSPISPIMLREGEYFMLGDNTAASKDSRLWDEVGPHLRDRGEAFQLGTVPRDQLIGKAFFVYWPAGYRIDWLPLLDRIGIIPDVGRMRWIR